MLISIIVAKDKNNAIGKGGTLPWVLKSDLKHFKEITNGHTIIMGRKTFESIGKALPNRRNIVISSNPDYTRSDLEYAASLNEALQIASTEQGRNFEENQDEVEVFIIGGARVYNEALIKANKLYITEVNTEVKGADVYFPTLDMNEWQETKRESYKKDSENEYDYDFVEYKRK